MPPKPTRTPERIGHSQDAITHEAAVAIAKAHNGGCSCPCHTALQSPAPVLDTSHLTTDAAARIESEIKHFGPVLGFHGIKAMQGPAGEWRDISTAPSAISAEPEDEVWVFGGRYPKPTLVQADGDWWRSSPMLGTARYAPTHWQPQYVPPPPTGEG